MQCRCDAALIFFGLFSMDLWGKGTPTAYNELFLPFPGELSPRPYAVILSGSCMRHISPYCHCMYFKPAALIHKTDKTITGTEYERS